MHVLHWLWSCIGVIIITLLSIIVMVVIRLIACSKRELDDHWGMGEIAVMLVYCVLTGVTTTVLSSPQFLTSLIVCMTTVMAGNFKRKAYYQWKREGLAAVNSESW